MTLTRFRQTWQWLVAENRFHRVILVVALGTNRGLAWGIMVQAERLDVPAAVLKRNDASLYRMPEFEG